MIIPVSYTHLDVYKRQVLNLSSLNSKITFKELSNMKKILVLLLSFAFCFSACKTTLSQEQTKETQQLATSLSAAGFLGTSFQNSSDFWEKYFADEETYRCV